MINRLIVRALLVSVAASAVLGCARKAEVKVESNVEVKVEVKVEEKAEDKVEDIIEDEAEEKAVAFIEGLHGNVTRDVKLPGDAVIGVSLSGTKVTDAGLKELALFKNLTTLDLQR